MKTRNVSFFRMVNAAVLLVILGIGTETGAASFCPKRGNGELCTYRFSLVTNKNDKLCKETNAMLNVGFRHMFDYTGFAMEQMNEGGILFPIGSRYPTNEYFEAVPWRYPKIFTFDGQKYFGLPVAELDMDNDGEKELVIKDQFYPGDSQFLESLRIYKKGDFDLERPTTMTEVVRGQEGKKVDNRSIIVAGIIRPFIFDATTYLLYYTYFRPDPPTRGSVHEPPQRMFVEKYVKGSSLDQKDPLVLDIMCEFKMVRIDAR